MAVQKNFVIQNGLEVNNNLIYADKDSNKVGIGTTNLVYKLNVNGGIGATDLNIVGFTSVKNIRIDGSVSIGSSLGSLGQYLVSTGTGVTWSSIPRVREVNTQVAGVGATVFNTTYIVGLLDVYVNGVKLSNNEFVANDSATVSLNDACFGGETIEFISYFASSPGVGFTGIQGITVLEEGSPIGNPLQITSINFVGGAVTSVGSGFGVTVYISGTNYVQFAGIATYATTAGVATYASTAGVATYAPIAGIATYAPIAGIATLATTAGIATYANNAGVSTYSLSSATANYADNAGIATYATTAGTASNVIGGIASVTSVTAGIVTATSGFVSIANTTPVRIELVGNQLTFSAVGIGSTTFTLF